ncbi:hypothetical protein [Saccharicrinis fermentans]|uniref:Uncharacterized protein n=1 Tax=Saccharicrinis fermentans DSM 9555 = JCM 21142 TaxID=869213 RepID=W7YGS7_9BACT|nr:hypothetical protein [Saccharicrinis fermentans]GAF03586.1 hypothetical protein JCM21142_52264 [Saccharicrinis fermentans DSM 9555 = JCM 21142]
MNNKKTASNIQMIFTFLVVLLIALFLCSLTVELLTYAWLQWISGIVMIGAIVTFMSGGYFYCEMNTSGDDVEVKFYNVFPFGREYKMFRIPIAALVKYEIKGNRFYRRKLVLFQTSSGQLTRYPPIFIAAFSKQDMRDFKLYYDALKSNSK